MSYFTIAIPATTKIDISYQRGKQRYEKTLSTLITISYQPTHLFLFLPKTNRLAQTHKSSGRNSFCCHLYHILLKMRKNERNAAAQNHKQRRNANQQNTRTKRISVEQAQPSSFTKTLLKCFALLSTITSKTSCFGGTNQVLRRFT